MRRAHMISLTLTLPSAVPFYLIHACLNDITDRPCLVLMIRMSHSITWFTCDAISIQLLQPAPEEAAPAAEEGDHDAEEADHDAADGDHEAEEDEVQDEPTGQWLSWWKGFPARIFGNRYCVIALVCWNLYRGGIIIRKKCTTNKIKIPVYEVVYCEGFWSHLFDKWDIFPRFIILTHRDWTLQHYFWNNVNIVVR